MAAENSSNFAKRLLCLQYTSNEKAHLLLNFNRQELKSLKISQILRRFTVYNSSLTLATADNKCT